MSETIILASQSEIRATLLQNAGLTISRKPAHIDEASYLRSFQKDGKTTEAIALSLSELKAQDVSRAQPTRLVIGCDQTLDIDGICLSKPKHKEEAIEHLELLSGKTHSLFSAVTICEDEKTVWQHNARVDLHMRELSATFIETYVERNWSSIQHAVGCYKLEEEGAQLFTGIVGDYFSVLGLPLLEILSYLRIRGFLPQ